MALYPQDGRNGAIISLVCRGKLSQGINFSDDLARVVFMIGIPFLPSTDAKIQAKVKYRDNLRQQMIEKQLQQKQK